jgi:hypothetical protein
LAAFLIFRSAMIDEATEEIVKEDVLVLQDIEEEDDHLVEKAM